MDTELLGLPAEVGTALALIASGVIVPAVTAILKNEGTPSWAKRVIPIVLSALAAVLIVVLAAGGSFAEQAMTWILVAATVVGIAQTVYALMPGAWKGLEEATSKVVEDEVPPSGLAGDEQQGQGQAYRRGGYRGPMIPIRGAMGTYSTYTTPDEPEPESKDDARE